MILTAGLSPAWQQILVFDRLTPGQVNRATVTHTCASGKVLNVGLALARLGTPCTTLSLLGGATGRAIADEFAALAARTPRMETHWVACQAPTRTCTTLIDRHTAQTTELVENAAPVSANERAAFVTAYQRLAQQVQGVVLSGSLPEGTAPDLYRRLLERTPGWAVLDFRGDELWQALPQRPLIVKPNREELARTVSRPLDNEPDLRAAMQSLVERGARWVLVTAGAGDANLLGPPGLFRICPLAVEVVNPIASGDCLAAGFAARYAALTQTSLPMAADSDLEAVLDALRYGFAAAAENARELLPARLDPARVAARAAEVVIQRAD